MSLFPFSTKFQMFLYLQMDMLTCKHSYSIVICQILSNYINDLTIYPNSCELSYNHWWELERVSYDTWCYMTSYKNHSNFTSTPNRMSSSLIYLISIIERDELNGQVRLLSFIHLKRYNYFLVIVQKGLHKIISACMKIVTCTKEFG